MGSREKWCVSSARKKEKLIKFPSTMEKNYDIYLLMWSSKSFTASSVQPEPRSASSSYFVWSSQISSTNHSSRSLPRKNGRATVRIDVSVLSASLPSLAIRRREILREELSLKLTSLMGRRKKINQLVDINITRIMCMYSPRTRLFHPHLYTIVEVGEEIFDRSQVPL